MTGHVACCDCDSCLNSAPHPPRFFLLPPRPVERLHMRCDHGFVDGLCQVPSCPHWDGVGKGAKAQATSVKRTCATCPKPTTKVHCTACSRKAAAKDRYNYTKSLQREGA